MYISAIIVGIAVCIVLGVLFMKRSKKTITTALSPEDEAAIAQIRATVPAEYADEIIRKQLGL